MFEHRKYHALYFILGVLIAIHPSYNVEWL